MPEPAPEQLRTARLLLRRFQPADLEPFAAINADPRVMEHFPALLARAESDAFVERIARSFADDGIGLWALELRGRFVGFTGLLWQHPPLPFAPAVEVGWRLAADVWGQGLATEAARASLDDGFARLPVDQIVSLTARVNERSQCVMQRLGMTHAPTDDFDHPRVVAGNRLVPHVLYRMPRERWAAQAAPAAT